MKDVSIPSSRFHTRRSSGTGGRAGALEREVVLQPVDLDDGGPPASSGRVATLAASTKSNEDRRSGAARPRSSPTRRTRRSRYEGSRAPSRDAGGECRRQRVLAPGEGEVEQNAEVEARGRLLRRQDTPSAWRRDACREPEENRLASPVEPDHPGELAWTH